MKLSTWIDKETDGELCKFLPLYSSLYDATSSQEMRNELVIISIDILIDNFKPMSKFICEFLCYQFNHLCLFHIDKLNLSCT
jgi:hypothetical protein